MGVQAVRSQSSIALCDTMALSPADGTTVARDEAADTGLVFCELRDRVRTNKLKTIRFDTDVLTPLEREELVMRCTSLDNVVRGFGAQLKSIDAGEKEFDLSESCAEIGDFLSH